MTELEKKIENLTDEEIKEIDNRQLSKIVGLDKAGGMAVLKDMMEVMDGIENSIMDMPYRVRRHKILSFTFTFSKVWAFVVVLYTLLFRSDYTTVENIKYCISMIAIELVISMIVHTLTEGYYVLIRKLVPHYKDKNNKDLIDVLNNKRNITVQPRYKK